MSERDQGVVLDTLTPAERLAFVLHDTFAVPFEEIAVIVGRSPAAARQLASRARRRVRQTATVPDTDRARQRAVIDAFLAATHDGDFDALLVNGAEGLVVTVHGRPLAVMGFAVSGGRITEIDVIADPQRLRHLDLTTPNPSPDGPNGGSTPRRDRRHDPR